MQQTAAAISLYAYSEFQSKYNLLPFRLSGGSNNTLKLKEERLTNLIFSSHQLHDVTLNLRKKYS